MQNHLKMLNDLRVDMGHLKMLNDLRVSLVRRRYDAVVINALTEIFEKWIREEETGRESNVIEREV